MDGDDYLWKRDIVSNHYHCQNRNEIEVVHGEKGGLWGLIISVPNSSTKIKKVIFDGLWRKVGMGSFTLFWEHRLVSDKPLKDAFPRLYSISNQKMTVIADMGNWDGHLWSWSFH